MIPIFLLPHFPYSAHSNSNLHIFVTHCHHFTYGDNATIAPHVLLLLFAIFLISIYLPLCYLTIFLLAYTSPYSLTIDLCTLLVFKQPELVVSPQFENQPRLTPLTLYLVTHPITPSHLYLCTSEIRTPGFKNEGITHKLKPSPGPYIIVHLSYLTH